MEKFYYKKSYKARLVLTRNFALDAYQAIKDKLSTFVGVKEKASFDHELIIANDKSIGMIRVGKENVMVYLALDPSKLAAKYHAVDVSAFATYAKYPSKIVVATDKALENALALIERAVKNAKVTETKDMADVNYSEVLYERTFAQLFKEGLIKQYSKQVKGSSKPVAEEVKAEAVAEEVKPAKAAEVTKAEEEDEDEEEMHKVTFTAKLLYCATNEADDLYIVTNVNNWDVSKAVKMDKVDDNKFVGIDFYPTGTKLEFKICRAENWENVEKGIWKEEIVNHHYTIGDNDLDVEDLIHNFRID